MKFIFIGLCGISFSSVGSVLSEVDRPAKVCTIIQARVLIFDVEFPITQGYPVSFFNVQGTRLVFVSMQKLVYVYAPKAINP